MKRGRPSKYSRETADAICAELAAGKDLDSVCRSAGMPDPRTVYRWLDDGPDGLPIHPEFRQQYARAREIQADVYAAQTVAIADKCREGKKTKRTVCATCRGTGQVSQGDEQPAAMCSKCDGAGGFDEITTADMVERARLQIDARKWYASKLAPKKYGDKVQQEISGPDGGAIPTKVTIEFV